MLFSLVFNSFGMNNLPLPTDDIQLNRFRLNLGYSSILQESRIPQFTNVFINLNYRTSNFDPFTKPFNVNWAMETGVNIVPLGFDEGDLEGFFIIPYVKAGPEMNLLKQLYIGSSLGLAASIPFGFFTPIVGLHTNYLYSLENNLYLEFELGFHTAIAAPEPPYAIYFSVGTSFK